MKTFTFLVVSIFLVNPIAFCGTSITIVNTLTPSQIEENNKAYNKRLELIQKQVDSELNFKRKLAIEVAKHQVALDLQSAGASNYYISSSSSSFSNSKAEGNKQSLQQKVNNEISQN